MAGTSKAHFRFQFSLRFLLACMTVLAIFFSAAIALSYLEASGLFVSLGLLWVALRYRAKGLLVAIRILAGIAGLGMLWMVAVDYSFFWDMCSICLYDRDVIEYRVLSIPVVRRTDYCNDTFSRMAQDLGRPCPHDFHRKHVARWWGLVYRARPDIGGIRRLIGDGPPWYDEEAAEIVRARGRAEPGLADEFVRKILIERDVDYLTKLQSDVNKRRANGKWNPGKG